MKRSADFRAAGISMNRAAGSKEALKSGEISALRYEDYLSLYDELKEKRRY